MSVEALYLLKVSLCIATFYGLYSILFGRTTFFVVNRIYLLAGLILSFIIPWVELPVTSYDYHLPAADLLSSSPVTNNAVTTMADIRNTGNALTVSAILQGCYGIGLAFMLSRLLFSIVSIIRLKKNSEMEYVDGTPVLQTTISQPFSFFKWIFLPKHEKSMHILNHEKVHVRQWHSIDLLFEELTHAILWFNPIMIFYKRAVKLQHEYLADSHGVRNADDVEPYLKCMLDQIQTENLSGPVSRFYSQTIKNRIIMMTKNKTSLKFSVLYFLALPVVCLLLFSFSKPLPVSLPDNYSPKDGQTVIVVDAGHGGSDTGSQMKEGLSEKDFAMSLTSTLKQIAEEKGMKVILTRTGDQTLPLEDRMNVAKQFTADAFISIHASYNQQNPAMSGIDCFVSDSNPQFNNSKRLAEQLVNQLQKLQGIRVNGIKTSNFYVLKSNSIPAVVLELGYLSNASDYNFITESKNQREMAEKILAAIADFTK